MNIRNEKKEYVLKSNPNLNKPDQRECSHLANSYSDSKSEHESNNNDSKFLVWLQYHLRHQYTINMDPKSFTYTNITATHRYPIPKIPFSSKHKAPQSYLLLFSLRSSGFRYNCTVKK